MSVLRTIIIILSVSIAGCQNTIRDTNVGAHLRFKLNAKSNQTNRSGSSIPVGQDYIQDLWTRISAGHQLQKYDHNHIRVKQQQQWFASNPRYVVNAANRSSLYLHYVVERLEERKMPSELALLPMIESGYNPAAVSNAGAAGLWQFMPATGRGYNLEQTKLYDGRRDVTASTTAALDYLTYLHNMFNGDWLLALAAYNAGEGRVSRAIERNRKLGLSTDFWNLPLPKETRDYVPKLLALVDVIAAPQDYGVTLTSIANKPYFLTMGIGNQPLVLAHLAALVNITQDELYLLNPAFTGGKTTGGGGKNLLIPAAKAEQLAERLSKMNTNQLMALNIPLPLAEQSTDTRPSRWDFLNTGKVEQQPNPNDVAVTAPPSTNISEAEIDMHRADADATHSQTTSVPDARVGTGVAVKIHRREELSKHSIDLADNTSRGKIKVYNSTSKNTLPSANLINSSATESDFCSAGSMCEWIIRP